MERKTHRESWKGEESVKDRFTLTEDKMVPFLTGEYTSQDARNDISAKVPAPGLGIPYWPMIILGKFRAGSMKLSPGRQILEDSFG